MNDLVLVTGGSGYLGSHCIAAALAAGHRVRTTVRSLSKADAVRAALSRASQDASGVEFAVADLTSDDGWDAAASGCDFMLHTASPFPLGVPKDADELIKPAREGALRALNAAHRAGVRRTVLTSSFAAIGYGHADLGRPFTEEDWTDLSGTRPVPPYPTSKTLAERAAWDFAAQHPGFDLATVNPVAILGAPLGRDRGTSVALVDKLVTGMPGVPRTSFGIVDVRDVADLHLRVMTDPAASGQRFLAISGHFVSMLELARILHDGLGDQGRKVPTRELPDWLVRLVGRFDAGIGQIAAELGHPKDATSAKAETMLGWTARPVAESILDTARSGLVNAG